MSEQLLTIEDLAREWRTTPASLHQRRYRGEPMPPAIKLGRRLLFRRSDVEKFVAERLETAA